MNKQTNEALRRRTLFSTRPLMLIHCSFILAALCCLTTPAQAAIPVPATGSAVQTFDTLPPAGNFSYLTIAGASADINDPTGAALDAQVQLNAATGITLPVVAAAGNPPALSGNVMWASDVGAGYLISRPTGVRFHLLMATLQNTSGSAMSDVIISFDYAYVAPVVEEPGGHRVYYSLTGAAGSWTVIPEISNILESRTLTATLSLGSWANNAMLYILWADENGSGSPDTALEIDNFSASPPIPVAITQQPANTVIVENRPVTLSVVVSGTGPLTYQWFKDANPILDATNRLFTIPNATLSDAGSYHVEVSNPLNTVTSGTATLTVSTDAIGPVLLNVKGDDTYTKVFLTWNELILIDAAQEFGSYQILAPDLTQIPVSTATLVNGSNVVLTLATRLQENTVYSVEAGFQVDLAGNATIKVGNPAVDPAHGVVTSVRSFVTTRGFARFQAYLGRERAETLATFLALPIYPDGSSFDFHTNVLYWPQTATPNVEDYVMRFTGLFVAPETGTHLFDPDHDDDVRFRIYPGEDTSGTPAELAAPYSAASAPLTGGPTLPIDLVAGQRYYYELVVREFGGGDHAGIGVTLPSGAVSAPIAGQYLMAASDPGATLNAGIAQQPQNQTIQVNHFGTLAVVATNVGGGAAYQWQLNTGGGFNDVTNGNASSYTTPLLTLADSGDMYRVLVTVPGRSITSSVVTLSVVDDTVAPRITSVAGGGSSITIFFDEIMDAAAIGEIGNYDLKDSANNPLALSSPVIAADNRSVSFTTAAQTLGELYTLHAENVPDVAGNPLAPVDSVFRSGRGFVLFQAYDTGGGNAVSVLTSHPTFPDNPRDESLIPTFDSRNAYPDDTHEGYGGRISGWFVAPATTDYIFYLRSDDASELWLSTDNTVANRVMIQTETGCCNTFSVHPSTPKSLVANQAYFIEVLWKEGTGGDFGQVAFKAATDPTDPNALLPISGVFLSAVDPDIGGGGGTPQITARRSGNNLVITWPGSFTTFVLETAPAIPSATWTPVSSTVVGGENIATIPIPASGNAFYRLRQ